MRTEQAGVAHKYVQAAQPIRGIVDHPPDRRGVREIRADHAVPEPCQRRRDPLSLFTALPEMNSNTITARRECASDCGSDTARGAGNKHRPTLATAHRPVILRKPDTRFRANVGPGPTFRFAGQSGSHSARRTAPV
jgi:hypothetical protein